MGFPDWTLWGMALSLGGALIALTLALLGQAPGFLKRAGLSGARLEQHVRAYTGYALALVMLAFGFFVAGVPLGQNDIEQPSISASEEPEPDQTLLPTDSPYPDPMESEPTSGAEVPTPATPVTGAFGGPPAVESEVPTASFESGTVISTGTAATVDTESPVPTEETASPTSRPPTNTPSATATSTASPTLTPTPIVSATAVIDTAGSTIWLVRSPGGQNLVTVTDQEIVILLPRHANQGGLLWREILTVQGISGWVQEQFISYDGLVTP